MTTSRTDALHALSTVRDTRAELAHAVRCPPWRHALFGVLAGAYVAGPAAGYPGLLYVCVGVIVAATLIVRADRRRMGVFVNGYRRGKTLPRTFALVGGLIGLCMLGLWEKEAHGLDWFPIAAGLVTAPAAMIGSMGWERTFRREMGVAT